jgi:hypothetical protein
MATNQETVMETSSTTNTAMQSVHQFFPDVMNKDNGEELGCVQLLLDVGDEDASDEHLGSTSRTGTTTMFPANLARSTKS